jgi:catechol 2,3-dioxygenase-like lactoylglutathione lyase family enzyme
VFDHVTIRVSDRPESERFYELVLGSIGIERDSSNDQYAEWDEFSLAYDSPPTRGLHIGFCAWSHEDVDRFWQTGVDAGYRSDGEPGMRTQYRDDYYGGFLLDPDGNSIEAVHYEGVNRSGIIDHVWLRVLDVPSAQAFYATIADAAHLQPAEHNAEYAHFRIASGGSLSLVAGDPSEAVHMAFPGTRADVDAFHRAAMAAGYRDNGGPGERPIYHPGYYAAFVLDPDANNIEVVSHRDPE